jgi:hypothetical protein
MRAIRHLCGALLLAFLVGGAAAEPQPEAKVELTTVKWPQLAKTIRQNAGKVIVVDFWDTL